MPSMLSVGFEYRKKKYYALVRIRERSGQNECVVTVMNGELETLLYGNHIFFIENGIAANHRAPADDVIAELRDCIANTLNDCVKDGRLVIAED